MSTPPIQYSGPAISADIPWDIRVHIQNFYQKLGNHTQAMSMLATQLKNLKLSPGSTTITAPSGGASVPISLGGVNNQAGNTSYTTTSGDDGVILLLNDASAVAVTLTSAVNPNFYLYATNFGTGLVTCTPQTGTINGNATFTIPTDGFTLIVFDGTNFWASAISAPTGLSVTIITAKLTTGGSNGSMTFTDGLLTAQTAAT